MRRHLQYVFGAAILALGVTILWLGDRFVQADSAPANHRAFKEKLTDTEVQFEMMPIPGGTFLMGSPPDEKGRSSDEGGGSSSSKTMPSS